MDFEEALRGGGTFVLKEGVDVSTLGVDASPTPRISEFSSPASSTNEQRTPRLAVPPATPTVVPPTPSPAPGPSTIRPPSSSPSTSSNELYYDAEDGDIQTKRRSLYRSPGTSSSPDLATLLRKAKERGGAVGINHRKEKRLELPPPLPTGAGMRPRSSTSSVISPVSSHSSSVQKSAAELTAGVESANGTDWTSPAPRSRKLSKDNRNASKNLPPRRSVRAKTSAFLGKIMGQGTGRERSRTDASTTNPPSLSSAFSDPVPPLPDDGRRNLSRSPIADVFIGQSSAVDTTKPLPPIIHRQQSRESIDSDDQSIVFVEKSAKLLPSPEKARPPDNNPSNPSGHIKKRSVSAGEIELKNAISASSTTTPLSNSKVSRRNQDHQVWDSGLHGILRDFKGELSQLDPISGSPLSLRDPSTPVKRGATDRSNTDGLVSYDNGILQGGRSSSTSSPGLPSTPLLTLQLASEPEPSDLDPEASPRTPKSSRVEAPIVPPRSSSLGAPIRTPSLTSSTRASPLQSASRHTSIPLRSAGGISVGALSSRRVHGHSSSRDLSQLRVHHRSASSSEPSLIPIGDEGRIRDQRRSIRLVPSSQSIVYSDATSPSLSLGSQQDLSASDLMGSNQLSSAEETPDMDTRGKELASRCWAEDEQFLAKEKIAEWLGGQSVINKIALRHYVDFFDFSGLRLDVAFRRLCAKLYLKAETQQVDRILDEFSRRYWVNNPNGVYGSASVVHAVAYSLLLLNTDLHVADLNSRMSRNQFVRNTLTAIQMQLPGPTPALASDLTYDDYGSLRGGASTDGAETIKSTGRSKRSGSITSWKSMSRDAIMTSPAAVSTSNLNGSSASVQVTPGHEAKPNNSSSSSVVYGRNWESEMENLLKEMYNAIKSQQILQPVGSTLGGRSSTNQSPGLTRNRSLRVQPDRLATLKRGSIRGLQSILTAQGNGASPYSSNSSIDGRVSPSPSFATSTHEALQGSSSSFLNPALGFASNLSHTIIREAHEDDDRSVQSQGSGSTNISITDEELALLGAPWAKEGMLCRKQYWDSAGKRAKTKSWMDVFVVISRGELNMFTFGDHGGGGSSVVGGGNWLGNAESVGTVDLAHSLAHALPPPGYNRQRPHCMVLTLANGGVYFFQAGTEELVNEWVSTCNYWAARTSKEPLAGGVSNMEYGWNRVADDPYSRDRSPSDSEPPPRESDSISLRSSRSVRSKLRFKDGVARSSQSPWVDRIFINDWKPPLPPTISSVHDEETQMEALQKHVSSMKKDLKQHNELREPMSTLYQSRSSNAVKAQANWEKKSQYLLTEIVKYESYIDSLQAAMSLRLKRRGEKALEKALVISSPEDAEAQSTVKGKRDTATEGTPGPGQVYAKFHRGETADGG